MLVMIDEANWEIAVFSHLSGPIPNRRFLSLGSAPKLPSQLTYFPSCGLQL